MKWNPFNSKIGLALGGGAAKGIAHIGVLKAFEEENLDISYLSGTSVGALAASYYAFGKPVQEMMSIASTLNLKKMANFTFKKGGLFSTDPIKEMVIRDLGDVRIEEAKIPLAICTTDLETGRAKVFQKGRLADIVCASMAVPGLFIPVEIEGHVLADGGIVENVPISPLESMGAGIRIGVDLSARQGYQKPIDTLDVINNAIDICVDRTTKAQLKKADLVISLDLSRYSRTDNSERVNQLFLEGYRPAKEHIRNIRRYKKTNLFHYLAKASSEVAPFKVPDIIKEGTDKAKTLFLENKGPQNKK